jgi:hypothetical protein
MDTLFAKSDSRKTRSHRFDFKCPPLCRQKMIELASSSVEVIGAFCFCGCHSLECVGFETRSHLERIEHFTFVDTPLTEVRLQNSVRFISGHAY